MASRPQYITAIIYDKRGRILSIGKNSYVKTHPYQAKLAKRHNAHKVFLHAEIDAIIKCRDLSKAHRISIFREGRNGKMVCAAPCEVCQDGIRLAGIKVIEHT